MSCGEQLEEIVPSLVRNSARVATVARMLDCDASQVRRLIRCGALEFHRVGKRGIRIYLDSVAAYQEAQTDHPGSRPKAPRKLVKKVRASRRSSLAELRTRGLLD